jgi:hypothetical protein
VVALEPPLACLEAGREVAGCDDLLLAEETVGLGVATWATAGWPTCWADVELVVDVCPLPCAEPASTEGEACPPRAASARPLPPDHGVVAATAAMAPTAATATKPAVHRLRTGLWGLREAA